MTQLARFSATTPGDPLAGDSRATLETRTEDVWINPEHVVWVAAAQGAPAGETPLTVIRTVAGTVTVNGSVMDAVYTLQGGE